MRQRDVTHWYGNLRVLFWTSAAGSRLVTIEEEGRITIIPKERWDKAHKALYSEDCARSLLEDDWPRYSVVQATTHTSEAG